EMRYFAETGLDVAELVTHTTEMNAHHQPKPASDERSDSGEDTLGIIGCTLIVV
ncbi:hypothetical protein L0F63_005365, partial [Massospora cicadina]